MGVAPVVGHEVGSLGEVFAGCMCVRMHVRGRKKGKKRASFKQHRKRVTI